MPNSTDEQVQDAPVANPVDDFNTEGTERTDTVNQESEAEQIDYKEKFSASSREAQRLLQEKQQLERELEEARNAGANNEALYPGFEELDEDAQRNLLEYTNAVKTDVLKGINNDPAIAYGRKMYNENKFNQSLDEKLKQYPDLASSKDEFKQKFFNGGDAPSDEVMDDLVKIHLFDHARDLGAQEERERTGRIDMERAKGGPRTPTTHRSLEEWNQIAKNPAEFAKLSKEYQEDLDSGKLGE